MTLKGLEAKPPPGRTRLEGLKGLVEPAGLVGAAAWYVWMHLAHPSPPGVLDLVVGRERAQLRQAERERRIVRVVIIDLGGCVGRRPTPRALSDDD